MNCICSSYSRITNHLLIIICSLLFLSCKQSVSYPEQATVAIDTISNDARSAKDSFETGKVINSVNCNNNSSQSFALYLPKNYSVSATYPVIYFFDAHASGRLLSECAGILIGDVRDSRVRLPSPVLRCFVESIIISSGITERLSEL